MPFIKQFLSLLASALLLFSCGPSADFDNATTDDTADSITIAPITSNADSAAGCIKVSNSEWTKLIGQQSDEIKNSPEWYASLDKHMAQKDHFCFGKTKQECLFINAEYQLVEVKNYCKPEGAKVPCTPTTVEEWSTLLVEAVEEVKGNADWFNSIDEHMKDPKHPCAGKSKEECLAINAEHLLTSLKNYCKPVEAKGPCTTIDQAQWTNLLTEAKQTIKDDSEWYRSLEDHMKDTEHPCAGKSKEECLGINAEYFLVEVKNYCKPK